MPYPHEHSARIQPPHGFKKFARENDKLGKGIDVVYGIDKAGVSTVQSIRFRTDTFTAKQAGAWLHKHRKEFPVQRFEHASDGAERRKTDNPPEGSLDPFGAAMKWLNSPWDT